MPTGIGRFGPACPNSTLPRTGMSRLPRTSRTISERVGDASGASSPLIACGMPTTMPEIRSRIPLCRSTCGFGPRADALGDVEGGDEVTDIAALTCGGPGGQPVIAEYGGDVVMESRCVVPGEAHPLESGQRVERDAVRTSQPCRVPGGDDHAHRLVEYE